MNFSSSSNITLSDSISGYITAEEDEDTDIAENTQYLSVLSRDLSFDGMNVTLSNDQDENEETQLVEVASEDGESLIFTVEAPDEIYGIQLAQDQEGNLQKYKIKYTENINGQLVPMLETIQILSLHDELQPGVDEHYTIAKDASDIGESLCHHSQSSLLNAKNDDLASVENMQVVPVVPQNNSDLPSITDVKEEILNLYDESSNLETQGSINYWIKENNEHEQQFDSDENSTSQNIPEELVEVEMDEINVKKNMSANNSEDEDSLHQLRVNSIEHIEQLFVEENFILEESEILQDSDIVSNNPDGEMFEIITDEPVISNDESHPSEAVLKESVDHCTKTNILKKPMQKSILKNHNTPDSKITYSITLGEKENLEVVEIERSPKQNSRSLLRCNQPSEELPDPLKCMVEKKYESRYYRTKEAKQARQFMNFINSTTIPQVPERKERLPRKQKIRPVKHPNEDIEVKEMIVSSGEFIEPGSVEEKKKLPVTEYVELIDSGDECKTNNSKKTTHKKPIEIEISDSEESSTTASALQNEKESNIQAKSTVIKKKRGRPPKNKNAENSKMDTDSNSESPPKISRTDDVDSPPDNAHTDNVDSVKSNFKVTGENQNEHCSTVKISQKSISNSEINDQEAKVNKRNIRRSEMPKKGENQDKLMNVKSSKPCATISQPIFKKESDYRYECDKCKSKFINKILLGRHNCVSKSGLPFSCDACTKRFPNMVSLNIHKKMHAKDIITTKGSKPNVGTIASKIPKVQIEPVSNSKTSVNSKPKAPMKLANTHNAPVASTKCSNSGKTNQKIHLKPKIGIESVTPEKSLRGRDMKFAKQCDKCPMSFDNNAAWFDHQVLCHGLKTPDKNIGKSKPTRLVKPSETHEGIPLGTTASKNFLKISAMIKQQRH